MKGQSRMTRLFSDLFGGEIIARKNLDRYTLFILYLFFLMGVYLLWGLKSQDLMATIKKNEAIIEEKKIEYHQKELNLTGIDQRTRIENMLKQEGNNTLHAPTDPPKRIVMKF
ncbi:MAG: hypothetical protein HUJ91_02860 [Bacteroidales bacterium]|nr:hypothetical protein [Bacteroidales bacterium]